jgi:hypothetical protein
VVIALLFTIVFFPLVGRAVSRTNWFLAGAGLVGITLFVTMVWHAPMGITLIALTAIGLVAMRKRDWRPVFEKADIPLAIGIVLLLLASAILPLADYDGRAFWMLKAKAIAQERAIDGPFFRGETAGNPRNEYPLLVPLDAAAIFTVTRDLDDRHARWLFALFAIAFALEIRRRCGSWLGAAFLWLPQILLDTANGGALTAYCDIALGAFVACAFFTLMDDDDPLRFGFWVACVALTKNEGLPFALLLLVAGAFVLRKRIAIALAPPLLVIAHLLLWRTRIARSDEQDFARTLLDVPSHLERFAGSLTRLLGDFADVREWGWALLMIAIAFFFARRGRALAALIVVPMLVLYAAAVAVSGWKLDVMHGLAPRVLTQLLGPLFFVLREAIFTSSRNR